MIRKQIPNFITLLNLFFGCIALIFAFKGCFSMTLIFVILGIIMDFFDGFAARILKVSSKLGMELDSMADMITSGIVPAVVMFGLFCKKVQDPSLVYKEMTSLQWDESLLSLLGFTIAMASAYRLANFNIDTRQSSEFIGLPTPANTLLICGLSIFVEQDIPSITVIEYLSKTLDSIWGLVVITLTSCFLLNAPIKLFSLKLKSLNVKQNIHVYLYIVSSILIILYLKQWSLPFIIIWYVILSIIKNMLFKTKKI